MKIDSLIQKAKERLDPQGINRCKVDNPFLAMSCEELINYMSADNCIVPAKGTEEYDKYMYALVSKYSGRR